MGIPSRPTRSYRARPADEVGQPCQNTAPSALELLPTHVPHAGSNAAFLDPGAKAVRWILTQLSGRVAISFDPNVRPAAMGNLDGVVG